MRADKFQAPAPRINNPFEHCPYMSSSVWNWSAQSLDKYDGAHNSLDENTGECSSLNETAREHNSLAKLHSCRDNTARY